ncbi:MAG TPA: LysR family transcriptional regulator [Pseudonocardiaceae bacterium]|jgi:DNA-binding transcriptional LysR family regulator|nr:LysR family transcriptional regulator [Pseudonocardiaceae bacterium]
MELRELRAFVAVVEEGGLSAAARRLHVSQPSLTQTMHALERELGVPLLTRTSTGTTPTDAGRRLLTEARAVLARYEQAVAAVARQDSACGGVLRLGVPLELPPDLLAKPFADLATACPDTRVNARHLSTAAQFAALRAGELDIGLVRESPIGPDLDAVPVVDERLGVLLATSIVGERAGPDGVRLEALAGLDWVGFPRSGSPAWYDQLTGTMRGHGIEVGEQPPDDQALLPEVKLTGVASGRAFAFAPRAWPVPVPEHVVWVPLVGDPLVRRTWAVWPSNSRRRDVGRLVAALEDLSRP